MISSLGLGMGNEWSKAGAGRMKNIRPAVLVLLLMLTAAVFFSTEFGRRDRTVTGPPLEFAGRIRIGVEKNKVSISRRFHD
jgi:hypothetical protein